MFIGKFLEVIGFREWVECNIPISETSNNGGGIYEKVLGQFITVLAGGYRFSHLLRWGDGIEVLKEVLAVKWLPLATSTLTRFWQKINTQALAEQVGNACRVLARRILEWENIVEDDLNLDSSVLTRYGHQEGAKRGYNPAKPGRASHHPLLAFLGRGYIVNLWNRSGDSHASQGSVDFFRQTLACLGDSFRVGRLLGDTYWHELM